MTTIDTSMSLDTIINGVSQIVSETMDYVDKNVEMMFEQREEKNSNLEIVAKGIEFETSQTFLYKIYV